MEDITVRGDRNRSGTVRWTVPSSTSLRTRVQVVLGAHLTERVTDTAPSIVVLGLHVHEMVVHSKRNILRRLHVASMCRGGFYRVYRFAGRHDK